MKKLLVALALLLGLAAYADEDVDKLAALLERLPGELKPELVKNIKFDRGNPTVELTKEGAELDSMCNLMCSAVRKIASRGDIKKLSHKKMNNIDIINISDAIRASFGSMTKNIADMRTLETSAPKGKEAQLSEAKKKLDANLSQIKSDYAGNVMKLKSAIDAIKSELSKK